MQQITRRMYHPAPDFPAWATQFIMDGRRAEVLMVVRDTRGDVWLHRKGDQPWRLPTGTLERGEEPTVGLAREVGEEFGASLPLVRALAVLQVEMDVPGVPGVFTSHIFLLDGGGYVPVPIADERIAAWRPFSIRDLYGVATRLRALTATAGPDGWRWPYWGAFRALEHELVADVLAAEPIRPLN